MSELNKIFIANSSEVSSFLVVAQKNYRLYSVKILSKNTYKEMDKSKEKFK